MTIKISKHYISFHRHQRIGMRVPVPKLLCRNLRKQKMFPRGMLRPVQSLLIILFFCVFIFCSFYIIKTVNRMDSESLVISGDDEDKPEKTVNSAEKVQACQIPKLDPFYPAIIKIMDKEPSPKKLDCTSNGNRPVLFDSFVDNPYPRLVPRRRIKSLSKKDKLQSCCYRNLTNGKLLPSSKCYPVSLDKPTIVPADREFIAIECTYRRKFENEYQNFTKGVDMHAFVHIKPEVVSRVMERQKKMKKLKKKGEEPEDKLNVIVLGLESMSRMNFIRTMMETRKYLMKTLNAVEMEGFNKIGDDWVQNIGPLLTNVGGTDEGSLPCLHGNSSQWCPFIWKKYADFGYHTLYTEDEVTMAGFDKLRLNFNLKSQTDYYFPKFAVAADKLIGHRNKSCYGPRPAFQVMLDYMEKMMVVIKGLNENYFQFLWSSSLTRDSINGGQHADKLLSSAIQSWHENGHLEKTVLILMSDQGQRFGGIRRVYQGQLEDRLPFMYLVLPKYFQDKYPMAYRNLISNRKRLITSWDLYQSLHHLLQSKQLEDSVLPLLEETFASKQKSLAEPGISLFFQVPLSRTCESAGVPVNHCTCNHRMEPLPFDNPLLEQVANQVLQQMNSILSISTNHLCCYLYLDKILDAGVVSLGGDSRKGSSWEGYQVLLQTTPGYGTFEALLVHHPQTNVSVYTEEWSVIGNILRTNSMGNQSWCLEDQHNLELEKDVDIRKQKHLEKAKKYCYCLPNKGASKLG